MNRFSRRLLVGFSFVVGLVSTAGAETFTWQQLRDRFETTNPTLRAAQLSVDESKAGEITANLRPNPNLTLAADGTQLAEYQGVWKPFVGTQGSAAVDYLHERDHKRELRLESAKKGTAVTISQQQDAERNLLFNLRNAFVQVLQNKAILAVAKENLDYYDHVISIGQVQLKAGDISHVDLDRLELTRVQYESELETADVNLRTSKITLLTLMNDRTPVDQFDVAGTFDFAPEITPLDELHRIALATRPDLRAAMQSVDKAKTDHRLAVANGSTDPTFSLWVTQNPSFNNPYDNTTIGGSVSVPLRIFDRNQGEKERTELDIRKNERMQDAAEAQVFSDVDSAYATLNSSVRILVPYKEKYLGQALRVRDTITFAYQHGGSSLLDFLSAQNDYRSVQLNYLNLVGSYMTAASQLESCRWSRGYSVRLIELSRPVFLIEAVACVALAVSLSGCAKEVQADPKAEAPPPSQVIPAPNSSLVNVDKPEQFPLVTAGEYNAAPQLNVTGTISPDVSRNVPVISLASGRVIEVLAKLGDDVAQGQLLMKVQSPDISGAFSDYRQAVADQVLAHAQLDRAKTLLEAGAMAQKDYEVAVDTEEKARVTVETAEEHLKVLGVDKDHPTNIVNVYAPVAGVITDQQVTTAAGTQGLASPTNPFTISDLSHVWVLCDVFENDLKNVKLGEYADVRLNAYPDRVFRARISNIGPILDPTLRTAKVRLQVENPGLMRLGMFVTATFHGEEKLMHALVPATAILHLHDRDWVYRPAGGKQFKRAEVVAGITLPDNTQEVSGILPGDQVVRDALVLENTVEQ